MTEIATALYVKQTGSVLGVVTRVGDPAGTVAADTLAGTAFPVLEPLTDDVLVEVEPAELDVKNVPLIDDLVLDPQNCYVDADTSKAVLAAGAAPAATLSATGVKIDIGANATEKTPVWAQVEWGSGSNRRRVVLSGEVPVGTDHVDLANTFASGDYDLLALAARMPPALKPNQNVP